MIKYISELMRDQRNSPIDRVVKGALWLCSLLYSVVVCAARFLYARGILPSYKSPKPVISVGNITVGGAGKTPLAIAVVHALRSAGLHPAVLSRGHGSTGSPQSMAGADKGDEPQMMAEILTDTPVLIGADRGRNIRAVLEAGGVDVFVCDDGFQHWPLQRQLDIVAVDAVDPFGNGCVLPRGILREPLRALKRAHVFVMTRTDRDPAGIADLRRRLRDITPDALIVGSVHQPLNLTGVYDHISTGLGVLRGKKVAAFCAIADGGAFGHTLAQSGAQVARRFDFMDHHAYTAADLGNIRDFCRANGIDTVVTTHKDAVKIGAFGSVWGDIKVLRLNIALTITHGNEQFIERILSAGLS